MFELTILGYNGTAGMVGIPLPPNFNMSSTLIPEGDTYSYDELLFRLTYRGSAVCQITKMRLWQKLSDFGEEFNYTGVKTIDPPPYPLYTDDSYDFLVDSGPWPRNFLINNPISLRIWTETQGDFTLSTELEYGIPKIEGDKTETLSSTTQSTSFHTEPESFSTTPSSSVTLLILMIIAIIFCRRILLR